MASVGGASQVKGGGAAGGGGAGGGRGDGSWRDGGLGGAGRYVSLEDLGYQSAIFLSKQYGGEAWWLSTKAMQSVNELHAISHSLQALAL